MFCTTCIDKAVYHGTGIGLEGWNRPQGMEWNEIQYECMISFPEQTTSFLSKKHNTT